MLEGIGEKFKSLNDRGPQAPSPAYEEVTSAAAGGYGPDEIRRIAANPAESGPARLANAALGGEWRNRAGSAG